jgi:tRNA wybutosine-synthesizing protein 2
VVLVDTGDAPRPEEVGEALLALHGAETVLARGGVEGPTRDPDVTVLAGTGDTETVHVEHGTKYALDLAETMFSPGNKAERARRGDDVEAGEPAAEINPMAFRYLTENAVLNDVQDRVSPYRADCRDVEATADRVVMGHFEAHEYLDSALDALVPGGTVHYHEATPEALVPDRPVDRLRRAADRHDREVAVEAVRRVKGYSEGVHVRERGRRVVDAVVE